MKLQNALIIAVLFPAAFVAQTQSVMEVSDTLNGGHKVEREIAGDATHSLQVDVLADNT